MAEYTDGELARLQALADEASPGPWNTEGRWVMNATGSEVAEIVMLDDAEFIAAARAAVPALIAELRRLRAALST